MARMKLEVSGLDTLTERLSKMGTDIKEVANEALTETHNLVTEGVEPIIRKHKLTGATEASLRRKSNVEWAGNTAAVKTGFDISNGGLPSIFLMYGTPKMKKDQQMYNAFYGKSTKDKIIEKQSDVFYEAIRKGGG